MDGEQSRVKTASKRDLNGQMPGQSPVRCLFGRHHIPFVKDFLVISPSKFLTQMTLTGIEQHWVYVGRNYL
jgi:hypothetical protein